MTNETINQIYQDYLNGNYVLLHFNTKKAVNGNKKVHETVDIKDLIFHYIYYTYFKNEPEHYFDLSWYVAIPKTKLTFKNKTDYINHVVYTKYNIEPKMISIDKTKYIEKYSVKTLKQWCRDNKIKGFSRLRKHQLIQKIKDTICPNPEQC